MKTLRAVMGLFFLAFIGACTTEPVASAPSGDQPIVERWSGDYPVAALDRLPEGQRNSGVGYLANAAAFEAAWSAFRPGEPVPTLDFGTHIVVFVRNVDFYNRTNIFKVTLKDGVLEVLAMATLSAIPIRDRVAMAMAVVPRQGVRFVKSGETRVPVAE